jgi:hypothetical protein
MCRETGWLVRHPAPGRDCSQVDINGSRKEIIGCVTESVCEDGFANEAAKDDRRQSDKRHDPESLLAK